MSGTFDCSKFLFSIYRRQVSCFMYEHSCFWIWLSIVWQRLYFKYCLTENEFVETSMFRKKTHINFNEIECITFGKISLELSIKSKQKKIKAHLNLAGFRELVTKLSQKTGRTSIEMGISI